MELPGMRSGCRCKRARRARLADGRRKHATTRRRHTIQHVDGPQGRADICAPTWMVAEKWWPAVGCWAIDVANGNGWRSVAAECRILSEQGEKAAAGEPRGQGWNPVFSRAHRTGGAIGSGGGAVLCRGGTSIAPSADSAISSQTSHRIMMAWVDAVMRSGIHCMSLYLRDSEVLSDSNQHLLDEAAGALKAVKGPLIIGRDWNMSPQTLAASRWLDMVRGIIFATTLLTCTESTYDYFVVHRSIAHAVVGLQRLEDGGMNPDWASRLILRSDARRFAVRMLVRPPKVEGVLPAGPAQIPP
eukprot:4120240-Karenia_brevis.AAC.1